MPTPDGAAGVSAAAGAAAGAASSAMPRLGEPLPHIQASGCVYLDYNATTPIFPEAADEMRPFLTAFGNPSSAHAFGRPCKAAVDAARARVAAMVGADPDEIFFTSCGSESDNWWAALAVLAVVRSSGRMPLKPSCAFQAACSCRGLPAHGLRLPAPGLQGHLGGGDGGAAATASRPRHLWRCRLPTARGQLAHRAPGRDRVPGDAGRTGPAGIHACASQLRGAGQGGRCGGCHDAPHLPADLHALQQ